MKPSTRRRNGLQLELALVLALLAAGCAPTIRSFTAAPPEICGDGQVRINYQTSGKPSLFVNVKEDADDPDREILSFRVVAERFNKTTPAVQDVIRYKTAEPASEFVLHAVPFGEAFIQAVYTNTDRPSSLTLAKIQNLNDRPVEVEHNGRSDTLPGNGGSSLKFQGSPQDGLWKLTAPLLPGEKFRDPAHSPPDRLRLSLTLECPPAPSTP